MEDLRSEAGTFECLVVETLDSTAVDFDPTALLKSNAVPGVFGVFEVPNEANAPDPSPNAFDALDVGEVRDTVDGDKVWC